MNRLERLIYDFVKRNPAIKNGLVRSYQSLMGLIPVQRQEAASPVTCREGFFFGFHDKSPWSYDNRFLLAHGFVDRIVARPNLRSEIVRIIDYCGS